MLYRCRNRRQHRLRRRVFGRCRRCRLFDGEVVRLQFGPPFGTLTSNDGENDQNKTAKAQKKNIIASLEARLNS